MKIIIDKDIPFIKGRLDKVADVNYFSGDEISNELVKDADILIIRTRTKCNRQLLEGSKVKLIATATIGTDHIDIPWCENNGIKITSAPGCNAPGVGQYLFSSLFSLGFIPGLHKLGIVGHGNIGSIVKKWADVMGIDTLVCDPPKRDQGFNDVEYSDIDTLFKVCDAITLHVPFTASGPYPTLNLVNDNNLKLMKESSIIVNSSRGGVINETDLKSCLKSHKLRAVIDVWKNEPYIDIELLNMAEITTPHIAGYSFEGKIRATRMVLEAVADFCNLKPDLQGLELPPVDYSLISKDIIMSSYSPLADSLTLKSNASDFEKIRNNYNYRHEPLYL